jgi:hypothetical protein
VTGTAVIVLDYGSVWSIVLTVARLDDGSAGGPVIDDDGELVTLAPTAGEAAEYEGGRPHVRNATPGWLAERIAYAPVFGDDEAMQAWLRQPTGAVAELLARDPANADLFRSMLADEQVEAGGLPRPVPRDGRAAGAGRRRRGADAPRRPVADALRRLTTNNAAGGESSFRRRPFHLTPTPSRQVLRLDAADRICPGFCPTRSCPTFVQVCRAATPFHF